MPASSVVRTTRELGQHHSLEPRLVPDHHRWSFGGDQHFGAQFGEGTGNGFAGHSHHLGDLFMSQGQVEPDPLRLL